MRPCASIRRRKSFTISTAGSCSTCCANCRASQKRPRRKSSTDTGCSKESFVSSNQKLTWTGQPVPELPVADVERAQQYYKDVLGFEIGWLYPTKDIGAVSRGKVVIFF